MSNIQHRIKSLIKELDLNTSSFGKAVNVKYQTLYNVVSSRGTAPNSDLLASILKNFPHVRPDWLMHGQGEMFYSDGEVKPISTTGLSDPDSRRKPIDTEEREADEAIPFVPVAAEGSYLNGWADEEYIDHLPKFYLPFLGLGSDVYAFQVRGDSMSDRFNNGDVVFGQEVKPNDALRWGEVYVLLCNDGLVVKELRRGPDEKHFTLRSFNEHFDPYEVKKTEVRALYRYVANISFNSSNPTRSAVARFMQSLSEQMGEMKNKLENLPVVK